MTRVKSILGKFKFPIMQHCKALVRVGSDSLARLVGIPYRLAAPLEEKS